MSEKLRPIGTVFKLRYKDIESTDCGEKEYTYKVMSHLLCIDFRGARPTWREEVKCINIQEVNDAKS